ncbi:MAG: crossover junction endodeoxyribonuclease RuvC [Alphaproteobacteria bacterium]
MTVILGVDPGLQRTGWGIITSKDNSLSYVACGVIKSTASLPLPERLKQLHDGLMAIVQAHHIDEAALEETFVNNNAASALKLGHARGAVCLALSLANLPVYEYSATMVKKSVVGKGHADKNQVGMMVRTLLPQSKAESADSADALAVSICHAHHRSFSSSLRKQGSGI